MKLVSSRKILYFQNPNPLLELAESLISLTPKVSVIEKDIYADITCTENLMGGTFGILQKLELLLSTFKTQCSWVLTENTAWAKPLCLKEKNFFNPGESFPLLMSLPIESLALCGSPLELEKTKRERKDLVCFLRKIGIVFCSDYLKIPRTSLAQRFGQLGVSLAKALEGELDPPLPFFIPQEPLIFSIDTESLVCLEALIHEIGQILPALELRLQGRQAFIQQIKLGFFFENKTTDTQWVTFSQLTRDPVTIERVLKESLNRLSWSSPLHRLNLEIIESVSQNPGQLNLWDNTEQRLEELSGFVLRMKNRFGDSRVGFVKLLPHYLPEKSWNLIYPAQNEQVSFPDHSRPVFLFESPAPFYPSSQWKLTELERLNLGWWDKTVSRRYYLAEGNQGEKLWVFFDLQTRKWFCHGSYD